MKTSRELKEQRSTIEKELLDLHNLADGEKRSFTADEQKKWDEKQAELRRLDGEIKVAEEREALVARTAGHSGGNNGPFSRRDAKDVQKFSFRKAITELRGKGLSGLEAEIHAEGLKELGEQRDSNAPGLAIPSSMFKICTTEERNELLKAEKRAMSATGGSSGSEGGQAIPTDVQTLIPALKPALVTADLGATILSGLSGNVKIPRNNNVISAAWEGENTDADEASPTFDGIDLAPKWAAAYAKISWQLMMQSNQVGEAFVRAELENAIARLLDTAAINGSGSSSQPTGILNTSGIGSVAGGTNGAVPTWANIVDLESKLTTANALTGKLAYLTTPGIVGKMKQTEKTSTSTAQFIAEQMGAMLEMNGYSTVRSSLVPSTLDKGTSTGVCHAIIFGNWAELIIANWAGIFLTVDDITLAGNRQSKITISAAYDIAVRHAASFAAMKDAKVS